MHCRTQARTRHIALRFMRQELLFDVENNCYTEHALVAEENAERAKTIADVAQDASTARFTRATDLAFAQCTEALYPYTKRPISCHDTLQDDVMEEKDCYVMWLQVPEEMSATTITLLKALIHEFIVASVMENWVGTVKPDAFEYWRIRKDEARTKIQTSLMSRRHEPRRRMLPFP